jgi:5-methylthioadenosine/S-adenosylhomocysteine deaminase
VLFVFFLVNLFMPSNLLIKNGNVITGADVQVRRADLLIKDGRIIEIGDHISASGDHSVIDATDRLVSPGFIQTHIHLCQTLFRGSADDLDLLDWLRTRIWPMEAAHNPESISVSARLSVAEMIKSGTTAALTMETVRHTEAVLETVDATGFRATIGKCMMDKGQGVPAGLQEQTRESIVESMRLMKEWKERSARVRYCFAPRFAVSCTRELLEEVAHVALESGLIVHTHASESRREIEIVEQESGCRNVEYLNRIGLTGKNIALAHCVFVDEREQHILAETGTHVMHCPSSNLKLGSGLAPVYDMLARGVSVSLGADGAACNNNLDIFVEMRLAALLQKMRHGPEALPARTAFRLATIEGARTLGLEQEIGTIEEGKRADIVILNLKQLHCAPAPDPISTIVYAAKSSDVETVIIDGQIVMRNRELQTLDEEEVIAAARREYTALIERAGI